jgi:hypothetical protein
MTQKNLGLCHMSQVNCVFPSIYSSGFETFKVEMAWVKCKWPFHGAAFNTWGQNEIFIHHIYLSISITNMGACEAIFN